MNMKIIPYDKYFNFLTKRTVCVVFFLYTETFSLGSVVRVVSMLRDVTSIINTSDLQGSQTQGRAAILQI